KGKPEVTDFTGDEETLKLLASAEKGSEHPLASAIVSYATELDIDFLEVDDFSAVPGRGIKASIAGKNILVGNRKLMQDHQVEIGDAERTLVQSESEGQTAMLIAVDNNHKGSVAA